jgi:hypothetical protein
MLHYRITGSGRFLKCQSHNEGDKVAQYKKSEVTFFFYQLLRDGT